MLHQTIDPSLDWEAIRQEYQHRGRVEIRGFLRAELAEQLHAALDHEVPWGIAHNLDGQARVVAAAPGQPADTAALEPLRQQLLEQSRQAFRFWYGSYQLIEAYLERRTPSPLLNRWVETLNSPEFLRPFRRLTGHDDIRKADSQATCYRPGHFLQCHDDSGAPTGQVRRAAYVLSLTRRWRADWGGQLQFLDPQGGVEQTLLPRFNSLFLFRTPQPHLVSSVAPYAEEPRYSLTGWLRAD